MSDLKGDVRDAGGLEKRSLTGNLTRVTQLAMPPHTGMARRVPQPRSTTPVGAGLAPKLAAYATGGTYCSSKSVRFLSMGLTPILSQQSPLEAGG